jgi:competence protein ComEC
MPNSRPRSTVHAIGGFVAAMVATPALSPLPNDVALFAMGGVAALAAASRHTRWIVGAVLGVLLATCSARQALEHRVTACVDGRVVEMRGRVDGLPKQRPQQVQFDLAVDAVVAWPACGGGPPRRVRLTWYDGPHVEPRETWQVRVKLRGVRGYQNPGAFDYEGFALANAIDGVGPVEFGRKLADGPRFGWDRLRLDLRERFAAAELRQPGILLAMLTGDAGLMDERDWALFRATGTVHLMVISGLHLTIVGAVGIALGRAIARFHRSSLARRGATLLGVVCGAVIVTLYACLAGWGVAVLRAWIAAMAIATLVGVARRTSLPTTFAWVAAIVLVVDPLAPLQAGFWLSMVAVAVLLAFFAPRVARRSFVRTLVVAQFVMAIAMTPALTATIGGVAGMGPIANVVAVPVLGVIVVPIDLGAVLMMTTIGVGESLLHLADLFTDWTVRYLEALAAFGWIAWRTDPSPFVWLAGAIACGGLLLPLRPRHRALLVPCALLSLLPADVGRPQGQFRVDVLDVGQGLAVVVATASHVLLYDAGPRYRTGFDLGRLAVVPALASASIDRLDAVVLSHADLDHVGGFAAVAERIHRRALLGGEPVAEFADLRACAREQGWQWDGVQFRVFRATEAGSDNDRSCVLSITNGARTALLPGDVTARAESQLISWLAAPIDLLVVAHHGSRSSSTDPFVRHAMPRIAVYSAGYLNRFGHPHRDVVCRLQASGARGYATAYSGAVSWSSERPTVVGEWRSRSPPYWRVGALAESEWQTCDHGSRELSDHPP